MKIYAKKGDAGQTGLLGGTRVPKHHMRIDAYGNVDELNSYIGLIRDLCPDYFKQLVEIQDRLFTMGSILALDPEHTATMSLPVLTEQDVNQLEQWMDAMEAQLPEMKHFVLPGGHPTVSHLHIARCVCRRAERATTALNELQTIEPLVLAYLNRLSDYLFVLSRKMTQELGAQETPWIPKKG